MPTLTALTPHPRRAGRYTVSIDGAALTLGVGGERNGEGERPLRHGRPSDAPRPALVDAALVHDLALKPGMELPDDTLRSLTAGALQVEAMDRALGMLGRRAHSRRELERGLSQKGSPKTAIDAVVTQLVNTGLLDDPSFAAAFARSRLVGRGQSSRRVAAELAKRGVARSDVDGALGRVAADEGVDEVEQARRAAQKKMRGLSNLEAAVVRRRLQAYLMRQGFGGDVVRRVTAELQAK